MASRSIHALLRDTLVIIMAGGQGERLYPLTRDRAKPAVPFGGIYRIIDFTLSNCINSGLRRILVLTQYKSDSLNRHLREGWNIFHSELGECIYVLPPQLRTTHHWYRGTADAVYQNIYSLQQERPKRVLILAGDHIYKMDYSKMIAFHEEKRADLTIACIEVDRKKAKHLGIMQTDEEGRVIDFEEKSSDPKSLPHRPDTCLASMGIYVFPTEMLVRAVIDDAKTDSDHDFGKNVIPRMVPVKRVFAYPFVDENRKDVEMGLPRPYWRDIGLLDTYWEANLDLVQVTPMFNLYDEHWPIRAYQRQYPPAKTIFAQENRMGTVRGSLLSSGCIVNGGHVERSILSPGVRVHSHAVVSESILMDEVEIGCHARIRRAIIDKRVRIPEGFEIGYDPEEDRRRFTVSPKGIVVVPKGISLEST